MSLNFFIEYAQCRIILGAEDTPTRSWLTQHEREVELLLELIRRRYALYPFVKDEKPWETTPPNKMNMTRYQRVFVTMLNALYTPRTINVNIRRT